MLPATVVLACPFGQHRLLEPDLELGAPFWFALERLKEPVLRFLLIWKDIALCNIAGKSDPIAISQKSYA